MESIARTPKQIGDVVRRHRKLLGLSQTDLGAKTGLRQATISDLERGIGRAQLQTLVRVLSALGLELVIRERTRAQAKDMEDLF